MKNLGRRMHLFGLLFLALSILGAPKALPNDYYLTVLIVAGLNATMTMGLNLLLGFAGQISLGHAAFYGLSAYATGILTVQYAWPVWAAIAAGVALACVVAFLIGIPTLKLKGHYLAMGTLGFGIIVYIVFNEATGLTGGPSGFPGIPRLNAFGHTVASDLEYYYVVWGVVFLLFALSQNMVRSRIGRALRAIHTSESAAMVLGIDVARYKGMVFVLSAAYSGIAGALYAHYVTFISPSTFGFPFSVQLVTMVVLGGMASLWGALAGALFLTVLPEFLRSLAEYDILVYGAILVLCMMFMPGGLAEAIHRAAGFVKSLLGGKKPGSEAA